MGVALPWQTGYLTDSIGRKPESGEQQDLFSTLRGRAANEPLLPFAVVLGRKRTAVPYRPRLCAYGGEYAF